MCSTPVARPVIRASKQQARMSKQSRKEIALHFPFVCCTCLEVCCLFKKRPPNQKSEFRTSQTSPTKEKPNTNKTRVDAPKDFPEQKWQDASIEQTTPTKIIKNRCAEILLKTSNRKMCLLTNQFQQTRKSKFQIW